MTHVPRIGWSEKEIIWLRAALTLSGYECICALDDIASMSGRTLSAIRAKADALQTSKEGAELAASLTKRILVPAAQKGIAPKQISVAQIEAGRGR